MTWYDTDSDGASYSGSTCEAGMGRPPQTSAEHLASQRSNEAAAEAESVDYLKALQKKGSKDQPMVLMSLPSFNHHLFFAYPSHCESVWGLRACRHEYSPWKLLTCQAASLQTVQLQEDPNERNLSKAGSLATSSPLFN